MSFIHILYIYIYFFYFLTLISHICMQEKPCPLLLTLHVGFGYPIKQFLWKILDFLKTIWAGTFSDEQTMDDSQEWKANLTLTGQGSNPRPSRCLVSLLLIPLPCICSTVAWFISNCHEWDWFHCKLSSKDWKDLKLHARCLNFTRYIMGYISALVRRPLYTQTVFYLLHFLSFFVFVFSWRSAVTSGSNPDLEHTSIMIGAFVGAVCLLSICWLVAMARKRYTDGDELQQPGGRPPQRMISVHTPGEWFLQPVADHFCTAVSHEAWLM